MTEQNKNRTSEIVQLKFDFLNESISLRCPIENQEKIELAATKIKEKLLSFQEKQPNANNFQVALMVCLNLEFQNLVHNDEINNILLSLADIKKFLEVTPSESPQSEDSKPVPIQTNKQDKPFPQNNTSYVNTPNHLQKALFSENLSHQSTQDGAEYGTHFRPKNI